LYLKSLPCPKSVTQLAACLISLIALPLPAFADGLSVKVEAAWLRAVPPVASDTAAYMKIQNLGSTTLRFVGGSSPIAEHLEPMIATSQDQNGLRMAGMESVPFIEIAPGKTLELKPGGNHLMFVGLKSHPREGDRVKVTLIFAPGDHLNIEIPVLREEPR
jgi:periplasmic copper chaperone A